MSRLRKALLLAAQAAGAPSPAPPPPAPSPPAPAPAPSVAGYPVRSAMVLGQNMDMTGYGDQSAIFTNLAVQSEYHLGASYSDPSEPPMDDNGYPTTDFGLHWQDSTGAWPAGTKLQVYLGGSVTGIDMTNNPAGYTVDSNTYDASADGGQGMTHVVFDVGGKSGGAVIGFTGTKRTPSSAINTGLRYVQVVRPGYESTWQAKLVTDAYLALWDRLGVKAIRHMKTLNVESDLAVQGWSQRDKRRWAQVWTLAAAAKTRRDAMNWLCLPLNAVATGSNSFDAGLALACEAKVPGGTWAWEFANELWNDGYHELWATHYSNVIAEMKGFESTNYSGRITRMLVSASRTAGVLTIVLNTPHLLANGDDFGIDGSMERTRGTVTVVNATTFSIPHAGADGPVSNFYGWSNSTGSNLRRSSENKSAYDLRTRFDLRRMIQAKEIVRTTLGDAAMSRYKFVLANNNSGAADAYNGDSVHDALAWAQDIYGSAKIDAIATNPYFNPCDPATVHQDQVSNRPNTVYTKEQWLSFFQTGGRKSKQSYVQGGANYGYDEWKCLALRYGVQAWVYEGGIDTASGGPGDATVTTNNYNKSQAVWDSAMQPIYLDWLRDLARYGIDSFMNFNMGADSSTANQGYGNWGITEGTWQTSSPKLLAFDQFQSEAPPILGAVSGPNFDARYRVGMYHDSTLEPYPDLGAGHKQLVGIVGGAATLTLYYKSLANSATTATVAINGVVVGTITLPAHAVGTMSVSSTLSLPSTLVGFNMVELSGSASAVAELHELRVA